MKENRCLNFLKGVCCLAVVLLHCKIPGIIGDGFIYAVRFPVPVFFMISGYFCFYKKTEWIKRAQWKLLKLLFFSEAACGVITCWVNFHTKGETVQQTLRELALWQHPVRTLFCGTVFNGTLWYLYAMFWTWVVIAVMRKYFKGREHCFYRAVPVLWLVHIVGRLLIQRAGKIETWIYLFRSSLFYALPFVLFGYFLGECFQGEPLQGEKEHLNQKTCGILLVAGVFTMAAEFFLFGCYMDLWFSTILITAALFLYAIQHPALSVFPLLERIGKQDSMLIYVSHIPISLLLDCFLKPVMELEIYEWVKPFGTMLLAILFAELCFYFCKVYSRLR